MSHMTSREPAPYTIIGPADKWLLPGMADIRELWQARGLLGELVRRDIRVRYSQTALGAAWALLQPLTMMAIFTLVFGVFARVPSEGTPYALLALTGLVPWIYFATVLAASSDSLITSRELITKIYFPRLVIPLVPIVAGLVDLVIGMAVLLVGVAIWSVAPVGVGAFLLPIPLLIMIVAASGAGTLAAALNVQYRDIRYVIPFIVQAGLFVSPVIYPLAIVPERLRMVLALNPMTGVIESLRVMLLQTGPMSWNVVGVSAASAVALAVASFVYFRHVEQLFADIV